MIKQVKIRCKNSGQTIMVDVGSTLAEIYEILIKEHSLNLVTEPVCAKVNNKT
jgi:DeoR/GlpR family transcriptional regulator of sugar metabolism